LIAHDKRSVHLFRYAAQGFVHSLAFDAVLVVAVLALVVLLIVWSGVARRPLACPTCKCALRVRGIVIRKREIRCRICGIHILIAPGLGRKRVKAWWIDDQK
jgi:hypothetical protein